jgi:hypothetical protein
MGAPSTPTPHSLAGVAFGGAAEIGLIDHAQIGPSVISLRF